MAKWQVVAPNGHNLTINTGGYGDSKYKHGQVTSNERAAKLFPQYFIPIFDPADMPAHPPEVKEVKPKSETLEKKLLNEEDQKEEKPQMLTEVPKKVDFAKEEKEDAVEAEEPLLVETGRKKKSSKKK